MGTKYLIDTCVVIKYLNEQLTTGGLLFMDKLVDTDSIISFITKIELMVWKSATEKDILIREAFITGSEIKYMNDGIIEKTIEIRKNSNIKIPDAIIAGTSLYYNYTLISTNDNDFKKVIPFGLNYLNPNDL
jgi:predicted nucleic acid-binding protein